MNFLSFATNMAAVTLIFEISKSFKNKSWQIFPSTYLPSFIVITSTVSEKWGVKK
jgi:hypothetical protein